MTYVIPVIVLFILIYSKIKGTDLLDSFLVGCENGLHTILSITPSIIAITVSIHMMRSSGLLDILERMMLPIFSFFKIPKEIAPLAITRPMSGSASLATLADIYLKYGVDSKIGFIASIIMGSTETTFYTLSIYYKNTRVKNNLHIIPCAIFGDIVALLVGVWASSIFF